MLLTTSRIFRWTADIELPGCQVIWRDLRQIFFEFNLYCKFIGIVVILVLFVSINSLAART